MELRNTKKRMDNAEKKELQLLLSELGFYENGMELREMRQVLAAYQQSVEQSETSFDESEAIVLRESADIASLYRDVRNSTMISERTSNTPQDSSLTPEDSNPILLTVHADVHHALDWNPLPNLDSPPRDWLMITEETRRLQRKRIASICAIISDAEDNEPIPKRLHISKSDVSPKLFRSVNSDSGLCDDDSNAINLSMNSQFCDEEMEINKRIQDQSINSLSSDQRVYDTDDLLDVSF